MSDNDKLRALEALREQLANMEAAPQVDMLREQHKAKIRNRALLLLDQRSRSRSELHTRLAALEFEEEAIAEVLDDLERVGLVDDEAFASEWVRQRHTIRGKSRRALDLELQAKGVAAPVRAVALEQIEDGDEQAVATELATKKARSVKQHPADRKEYDKHLRRIVGMLARRGYGESMAFAVGKQALDNRLAEL